MTRTITPADVLRAHVRDELTGGWCLTCRGDWPCDAVQMAEALAAQPVIDATLLGRREAWSLATFGPGGRLDGVLAHIRKELAEIESDPADAIEWADLLHLAFDGAFRQGITATEILAAFRQKLTVNEGREWPDWRTADPNGPIEHVRSES